MKVLRSEVRQREGELRADIELYIQGQFAAADLKEREVMIEIERIVRAANRQIDAVIGDDSEEMWLVRPRVSLPWLQRSDVDRRCHLRRTALAELQAKVEAARVQLDRKEADLLRRMAIEALESEEAVALIASIPIVSDLVPSVRLAEIEAAMGDPPVEPF
jgi:hypothetical protein